MSCSLLAVLAGQPSAEEKTVPVAAATLGAGPTKKSHRLLFTATCQELSCAWTGLVASWQEPQESR